MVSLERGDGTRTDSSTESAEVLASAFSSVFVHEPPGPLPKTENLGTDNKSKTQILVKHKFIIYHHNQLILKMLII